MFILNFGHRLTVEQRKQIDALANVNIEGIRNIPIKFDLTQPLGPQVITIVDAVGLTSEEWQTRLLLINPPGYAPVAFVLLAELHGRIGHFPALIRLRPVENSTPTEYEVAELLNLQTIREQARYRR